MNAGKPTFKWDLYNGEGSIGNTESFRQLNPLLRCDILGDWISDLENEHDIAHKDLLDHWEWLRKKASALKSTPD